MKHDYDSGAYWKETIKLLRNVLILWFLVSFGAGILFVDFSTNSTSVATRWASGLHTRARFTSL